ncbi:conserved exported hypothetical protein [Tenacibaculum sp. 190524A05c]|uniref:InlB B-repeat-containing protein n=1 Tax=Tenacibaculum platacis TaxID=3137852 RepID=UPI0031FABC03
MKIKLCLLFLFTCVLVNAQIFVDKDATGSNDGSSWGNAYTNLQDALANDSSGDEIWIAEGSYSPGTNRTDSFILNQTNVKLYGGFNGTETLLSDRNVLLYKTILDGDVNGDDTGVGYTGVNRDENTLNIVKIQANNCTLDGITIANGHANDSSTSDSQEGSAILIDAQNVSIKNSSIEKNVVQRFGVIQMIDRSGFLNIQNTTFKDNYGNGGVTIYTRASGDSLNITITNSLFVNNTLEAASPSGAGSTGIIWFRQDLNFSQNVTITNCTLVNNKNETRGTANVSVPATLINASRSSSNTRSSSVNVYNSIFWGNRNSINGTMTSVGNDTSQTGTNDFVVETSVGEDNFNNFPTLDFIFNVNASTSNISNANPIFTSSTDFTLQSSSPFVNNGDSSKMPNGITTDLLGNERIQSLDIDYGCYESSHNTGNLNVIFVDKDATGNNDGSSWTNAYTDLEDALANDASNTVVWIAEGTYSPGASRTDSFVLDQSNVKLYGGFKGTESQLSDRDFTQYKTVLDGDVNGDDSGVGYTSVNRTDNTIHIVKIQADNCFLDGLTITNGQADESSTNEAQEGSAILIQGTNVTVKNCSIEKNVVSRFGVVQMIDQNGFLNIENTIFKNNFGNGGVTLYTRASNDILDINITNCLFENNTLESVNPTGQGNSGIIWFRQDLNFSQRVTITNCTFAYNKNNTNSSSDATLINASRISSVGQLNSLHVYNSIIWENRNAANNVMISMLNDTNQLDFQEYKVGNSVGQDGFGNISNTTGIGTSNPLFTNALNGNFTLKSNSPVIDTGDNSKIPSGIFTLDLQGNERIFNTTVDMGAYEFNPSTIDQFTLTLNATNGSVSTNPNPVGGTYDDGTSVTLTATPDSGYQFDGWSGDASGTTNPLSITMDADKTITAMFSPIQRTLTINATNGSVSTNPNPSGGTYNDGTSVTLTATPDAGYQFDGWSGDASGTTNPLSITMDADKTITAMFSPIQRTLTLNATNGAVSTNPNPTGGTYNDGTSVTLTATPDAGYQFDGWSGDASGTTNPFTITMDADKTVTAMFSPIQRKLTLNATNGSVSTNPNPTGGTYDDGTSVTLTATPNAGYQFDGWSGDASGTTNPLTITMDADKIVTAMFSPIQRTLTINATNGSVTVSPNPVNGTYDDGTVVTLTAVPDSGYQFDTWSGDATGTTTQITITMDANKTVTASFSTTLGVNEEQFKVPFKLYPNPVNTLLHIDSEDSIKKIKVYNSLGREVIVSSATLDIIDVTNLANGIYFMIIETENGKGVRRFIKR